MKIELRNILKWSDKKEDFLVGKDTFSDLQINSTADKENFYYFYSRKDRSLVKQFILESRPQVDYICQVVLIKKEEKFSPRLTFVTRDKNKKTVQSSTTETTNIKARVSLDGCHENFWKLLRYIDSLQEIEIPKGNFSLMSQSESEIVAAIQGRERKSIISIVKKLFSTEDIKLSQEDVNQLLKRRENLEKFCKALGAKITDENKWQDFFEENKWIFGYGLNYQILKQEQVQPHYGGTIISGAGGQRGDFLTSTVGDINFTVLVEIKTPETPLLQGTKEIRNGAWSLSKDLTDALSQIEANVSTWDKDGSRQVGNIDNFESRDVYTVQPKGILVIGCLSELNIRSKRDTFQRFRKSIHGIDILTFDELYNRAKFITEYKD